MVFFFSGKFCSSLCMYFEFLNFRTKKAFALESIFGYWVSPMVGSVPHNCGVIWAKHAHTRALAKKDSKSRTNPKCIEPIDAYFLVTDTRVQNVAKYSQKTFLKCVRRTKFSWAKCLLCWRRWCWLWRRWQRQWHRPQLISEAQICGHMCSSVLFWCCASYLWGICELAANFVEWSHVCMDG